MKPHIQLSNKNIVWVWLDLEMTGLSIDNDVILEVALILTNPQLQQLEDPFSCQIFQPECILEKMNDWCKQHHAQSGLLDLVRISKTSITETEVLICKKLEQYPLNTVFMLCGNSIYQDRLFINKYMPNFASKLHYRMIDISSVKELVKSWYPDKSESIFIKQKNHRAIDDIFESIKELKHYKNYFFIN